MRSASHGVDWVIFLWHWRREATRPTPETKDPGVLDQTWRLAFGITNAENQAFLGWNGYTRGLVVGAVIGHTNSNWQEWLGLFWTEFGKPGTELPTAISQALLHYHPIDFNSINIDDPGRMYFWGLGKLGGD